MFTPRVTQLVLLLGVASAPVAAVTINQFNLTLTEDFNSLVSTGTSSAVPAGWAFSESGTSANTTYTAGTGSATSGDTYSFGATGSSDRAFGMLQSGTLVSSIGTVVTNATGGTITSLTISYTGEQWRLGAANRPDQLDFGFSTDATGLGNGTWSTVSQLSFVAPNTGPTTGALDGNAAANRTVISYTLTGLNIANGSSLWLRWTDFNATGSDDGLAIDDFSIFAAAPVAQNTPDGLPLVVTIVVLATIIFIGNGKKADFAARTP
jgi:hypothetical protein